MARGQSGGFRDEPGEAITPFLLRLGHIHAVLEVDIERSAMLASQGIETEFVDLLPQPVAIYGRPRRQADRVGEYHPALLGGHLRFGLV